MKSWLLLVSSCLAAYLLGYLVDGSMGGLFFVFQSLISIGLVIICSVICWVKPRSIIRKAAIFISLVELSAIWVNLAAAAGWAGWLDGSLLWYYENLEAVIHTLLVLEVLALLIYPMMWAKNGGLTRLYRSILSHLASYLLADFGYSLGVQNLKAANMPQMRGASCVC